MVILLVVGKWFSGCILYDRRTNGGITLALGAPEGRALVSLIKKTFHPGWTSVSSVNPLTPSSPPLPCCGMCVLYSDRQAVKDTDKPRRIVSKVMPQFNHQTCFYLTGFIQLRFGHQRRIKMTTTVTAFIYSHCFSSLFQQKQEDTVFKFLCSQTNHHRLRKRTKLFSQKGQACTEAPYNALHWVSYWGGVPWSNKKVGFYRSLLENSLYLTY